jgi:SAM-dependent methyltransferase
MRLESFFLTHGRCVRCSGSLSRQPTSLTCTGCGLSYPVVEGRSRLMDPDHPFFGAAADLSTQTASGFNATAISSLGRLIPSPSLDRGMPRILATIANHASGRPKAGTSALIVGAGDDGAMIAFLAQHYETVVVSDVIAGTNVDVICDGAALPFEDACFDCAVAIAVLEHVIDPGQVVAEIRRVLRPGGLVAADTPFLQGVHMKQFDFTRFTDLGHRYLFRHFDELERGVSVGPGSALAWSLLYFFRSFAWGRMSGYVLSAGARLLFFWLKYFDLLLSGKPGAVDGAGGLYFIGVKHERKALEPSELVRQFRGM